MDSSIPDCHKAPNSNGTVPQEIPITKLVNGLEKKPAAVPQEEEEGNMSPVSVNEPEEWTPPDGGYGWVMVGMSFMTYFLFVSYTQLGVFFTTIQEDFNVSQTSTTWLNAAHTVIGRVLAIFTGQILARVGGRVMLSSATVLYAASYFATSYVDSFPLMFITFGLFPSIGAGAFAAVAGTCVQQYFTTKRSIASGLAGAGISIGTFAWSPLGETLVETYGWRNAFRIEAAVYLALGFSIVIFLRHPGNQKTCLDCKKLCKKTRADDDFPTPDKLQQSNCCNLKNICDFSLLKNLPLCVLWLGLVTAGLGYLINSIYMPVRAKMLGIDAKTAAFTTSAFGIAGGVGVQIFAFLGNIQCIRRDVLLSIGLTLGGTATLVSTLMESSELLLFSAALIGLFGGTFISLGFVNVVDMVERHMIPIASGFHTATLGISHLIAHPVSGLLLDETNNPQAPFYLGGVAMIVGGLIVGLVPIIRKSQDAHNMEVSSITMASLDQMEVTGTYTKKEQKGTEEDVFIFHA